ncbi:MAG: hypothetical protein PUP92_31435 [Rhizonema sp. PD38]|nr:hypothetical protein [Rhizonema sp. PD38]
MQAINQKSSFSTQSEQFVIYQQAIAIPQQRILLNGGYTTW